MPGSGGDTRLTWDLRRADQEASEETEKARQSTSKRLRYLYVWQDLSNEEIRAVKTIRRSEGRGLR